MFLAKTSIANFLLLMI